MLFSLRRSLLWLYLVILGSGSVAGAGPTIRYVDDDAPADPIWGDPSISDPLEDGSVDQPFDAIQEALDASADGDEVRVATGFYSGSGNGELSFLGRAIRLVCGAPGAQETCTIEGPYAYGIRFSTGESADAVLDGFEFIGDIGVPSSAGVGILVEQASPTIRGCSIRGFNTAGIDVVGGHSTIIDAVVGGVAGPAIRIVDGAGVRVQGGNVSFCGIDNQFGAVTVSGGRATLTDVQVRDGNATGIVVTDGAEVALVRCTVADRNGEWSGGGLRVIRSTASVMHSKFLRNSSYNDGGGVYVEDSQYEVSDTIVAFNEASVGGGIALRGTCSGALVRCTVAQNLAPMGTNLATLDGAGVLLSSSIVRNVRFPGHISVTGELTARYCCLDEIRPDWNTPGSITADPAFIAPLDALNPGFELLPVSPCINRGDPYAVIADDALDFGGAPRVQHCRVDMGAFESGGLNDCNANAEADSCELHDGRETDCNHNDIPDRCDLTNPPIVFHGTFPGVENNLDPFHWFATAGVENDYFVQLGGWVLHFHESDSFAETRTFDLAGAEYATLHVGLAEWYGTSSELDIEFWDGSQWRLLRRESPVFPLTDSSTPVNHILDLPREAMLRDARLRFRVQAAFPTPYSDWYVSDVIVTRSEADCNGDGAIEACQLEGTPSDDCNGTFWPDACEAGPLLFGYHHLYAVGDSPSAVAVGDYDHDGDRDLAVIHGDVFEVGFVRLLLGDGQGAFTVAEDIPVGYWPRHITAGDLNGDHDVDLVVANGHSSSLTILDNLGGLWWGFKPRPSPLLGLYVQDVAIGDMDGDGDPDLVASTGTVGAGPWRVFVLTNDGQGVFTIAETEDTGIAPRSLTLFDAEPDGDLDVAVSLQDNPTGIHVFLNEGRDGSQTWRGLAAPPSYFAAGAPGLQPFFLAAADFNRDGFSDIAVAMPGENPKVAVYLNRGADGTGAWLGFRDAQLFDVGPTPFHLLARDLTGDGWPDLVVAARDGNTLRLYRNRGESAVGEWQGIELLREIPVGDLPTSVAVADFNRDGAVDLIATNRATNDLGQTVGTPTLSLYFQTSSDSDCNNNTEPDRCEMQFGSAPDCNNDNVPDVCQPDCDGDGVLDRCEIASGAAPDCNGNDVPDPCDLADGTEADCDGNTIPDTCEVYRVFIADSGYLWHIGVYDPQQWTIIRPPPAAGDVTIEIVSEARLNATTQYINIALNQQIVGSLFGTNGSVCPRVDLGAPPYVRSLTLSAAAFNAVIAGGNAVWDITTPAETYCPLRQPRSSYSYAFLTVTYPIAGSNDCNRSGSPDICDLASGASLDLNDNAVPDECDGLGDANGSGRVDLADLVGLPACVLGPGILVPPGCEIFDFDGDLDVDAHDLHGLVIVFGR